MCLAPVQTPAAEAASTTFDSLAVPELNPLDDPPDVDISTPLDRSGFNTMPDFQSTNPDGSMPDMLSAFMGGSGGSGGPMGMAGFPAQFAQMLGGGPGSTPVLVEAPRPRSWTDRLLPLMHVLSMVSLAFYAVFVLEPRLREGYGALFSDMSATSLGLGNVDWNGWAALGRGKQAGPDSTILAKAVENAWEASGHGVAKVVRLNTPAER